MHLNDYALNSCARETMETKFKISVPRALFDSLSCARWTWLSFRGACGMLWEWGEKRGIRKEGWEVDKLS